ncbi:MAG: hypothetical protein JW712_04450 [Dehalococcoidales bacterium]|nr:hypothetical protein [Dehalococcoidales bacterium]
MKIYKYTHLKNKDNLIEKVQAWFHENPEWRGTIKSLAEVLKEDDEAVAVVLFELAFVDCPDICIDTDKWEKYLKMVYDLKFSLNDSMIFYSKMMRKRR